MPTADLETHCINTIRTLAMDIVQSAKSGHPGMPMGMADVAYVLWTRFLKHDPADPYWPDRDRFVLSAGHGCALQYIMLHLSGYDLSLDDLKQFRQWGSRTPGHPEYGHTPGVEATTGPLGQGLADAVGMALAERFLAATFNRLGHEVIDHFTYAIASDGDLMEGIASEAASLAGHLALNKLIVLYDDNSVSLDGPTNLTFSEDVGLRFEAYNWRVFKVNGHDVDEVAEAIRQARTTVDRPTLIMCRTHIGFGSPHKQDTSAAHGSPLGEEEVRLTKERLGWPPDSSYLIPDDVRDFFAGLRPIWSKQRGDWERHMDDYTLAYPAEAELLRCAWSGDLPAGWEKRLPALRAQGSEATRITSGAVLQTLAAAIPTLIGGSADLLSSNMTYLKGIPDMRAGQYAGRNIHFGVREHAMGGILNGLALHGGVRPYGGTFLVFSDYMRPSIRLAALMGLPVTYVFTHDSIYLGEDGPTHQPIEHLAALRAIPRLTVVRPADANETIVAWKTAMANRAGPTALILSRQNLTILPETFEHCEIGLPRGGYTAAETPTTSLDVILIATGSEVSLAMQARERLRDLGVGARVVSLPSWDLFDRQSQTYQDEVLPTAIWRRVAIEAGTAQGWCRYIGSRGKTITIDGRFGASAPGTVVGDHLGFTVDHVVQVALTLASLPA